MGFKEYFKGSILIALVWINDYMFGGVLDMICSVNGIKGLGVYKSIINDILSMATTIIILVTAIIKLRKEKKNK